MEMVTQAGREDQTIRKRFNRLQGPHGYCQMAKSLSPPGILRGAEVTETPKNELMNRDDTHSQNWRGETGCKEKPTSVSRMQRQLRINDIDSGTNIPQDASCDPFTDIAATSDGLRVRNPKSQRRIS